ncbi:hypothetical protein HMPREF1619_01768 [Klebsiella pneumoniae 909957]|nr:hypothetical protein HMPREF1619_01768 [Klebsiella pneumoniae 909957]
MRRHPGFALLALSCRRRGFQKLLDVLSVRMLFQNFMSAVCQKRTWLTSMYFV